MYTQWLLHYYLWTLVPVECVCVFINTWVTWKFRVFFSSRLSTTRLLFYIIYNRDPWQSLSVASFRFFLNWSNYSLIYWLELFCINSVKSTSWGMEYTVKLISPANWNITHHCNIWDNKSNTWTISTIKYKYHTLGITRTE